MDLLFTVFFNHPTPTANLIIMFTNIIVVNSLHDYLPCYVLHVDPALHLDKYSAWTNLYNSSEANRFDFDLI